MGDLSSVFGWESFASGASGSAGGVSAITVFYPLNVVRTKLQCDDVTKEERSMTAVVQDIIKTEGIGGLFVGYVGQVIALGTSNFIYFYAYSLLKQVVLINKETPGPITPFMNLAVGAVAGAVNVLMTTPLWMVHTQLTVQAKKAKAGSDDERYNGMIDGLSKCYKNEGIAGLWKGLVPNMMLVSNPTIHFVVYERVRLVVEKIAAKRGSAITALEFFLMGALAKAVATVLTYPVQLAQSKLRADRKQKDGKRNYSGTFDCLRKIHAQAGTAGLFRGMRAKMWQTVLTAAFQFMMFEKIKSVVFGALVKNAASAAVKTATH